MIIAHRCGNTHFPENTVASAMRSLNIGADFLEMDVRFTRDAVPVVVHDDCLWRLFGTDKKVGEIPVSEFIALHYLNAKAYYPNILEDFLREGLRPLLLHIKEGGTRLEKLVFLLGAYQALGKVVFGVTSIEDQELLKSMDRNLNILGFIETAAGWQDYLSRGAGIIRLWDSWVAEEIVRGIHDQGGLVWVMTGNPFEGSVGQTTRERLLFLRDVEVDGILVNDPLFALKVLSPGD
jgi:glycerophosphoryl diester phosphodiesterase